MYYAVLVASKGFRGHDSLVYKSIEKLSRGQLVAVPMQGKTVSGIVDKGARKPDFDTKLVSYEWPLVLPETSLGLLRWLQDYYPAPLGTLAELFVPPALNKNLKSLEVSKPTKHLRLPPLSEEQARVIKLIAKSKQKSHILHGDTATGKTRVYLELAKSTILSGKSVIVLTPEIGLTTPLVQSFASIFGNRVLMTHSNMTPAQRRTVWLRALEDSEGLIVVGPRSALFTPLKNVGLIVMDESHDSAYKQEHTPRYQTSRVAAYLARLHGAQLIMGSATPLVTDYYAFQTKKLNILRMTQTALTSSSKTSINIVDLRQKELFSRSPHLSDQLLAAISDSLSRKEQTLLFLNRRGSARLALCSNCGWQALCPHCDTALTYHHDNHRMFCHSCNFSDRVPTHCPDCQATELIFRSIGTKSLQQEIEKLFPDSTIGRFDRDTEKALQLSQQFEQLKSGATNIIIGTQTVAKGFDLPKLSVVGVVQADSSLQFPDFTANERTYQLLSQVSGRIGRGHRASQLFVQTYQPDSPLLNYALRKNYDAFYTSELKQREQFQFPPFVHLLKISASRATSKAALNACLALLEQLKTHHHIAVEGPSPRFIEKIAGRHSWHLIVKAKNRQYLLDAINATGNTSKYNYDLDPVDLL